MPDFCAEFHALINKSRIFTFPFEAEEIPLNGIYIFFEKGELAHGVNRVVRIGTHKGRDQLRSRLQEHFVNKNKDRSIFRKNIGRVLLAKDNDQYLKVWEEDCTTKEKRDKCPHLLDRQKQNEIEKRVSIIFPSCDICIQKRNEIEERVSCYMQNNFSFAVFAVDSKEKRLELESKIISTISHCEDCQQSKNWLGNYSPKEKIRKSGLWQEQGLWQAPLLEQDMQFIRTVIK
jgi:hypothetical protein